MKPCFLADNILTGATIAAAEADGFPAVNLSDRRPYTKWQSTGTATQRVTVDCGADKTADTVALTGHNLAGCTLTVETSPDGVAWSTVISFTPSTDLTLVVPFGYVAGGKRFSKTSTAQHWALKIEGATVSPEIGVLMIGTRFELPRFPAGKFTPETETAKIDNADSKTGLPLGSLIRYRPISTKFSLMFPGADWTHDTYKPFYDANIGQPMFFAWELDRWPEKVMFGKLEPKYAPSFDALARVDKLQIGFNGVRS